ncbi:hypothetical protein ENUP19_0341G0028 [Entamoeba nuttalli]|uniref:Uncharacterized protein n=2 Tax=Entamoeba nuttalli TaxID=412467 RepID=K2GDB1_ENTNP|nr:hypothetical protein ENU1_087050 [Entamoeba nuttalli P19]EKE40546.1 hypothetical protein ENU1_087050 [Entamoeba nuttalli P19]|eukprot:XP_008857121.1 hypothetical protein ENU1_087050 [Entamoeba nuttalli P19]
MGDTQSTSNNVSSVKPTTTPSENNSQKTTNEGNQITEMMKKDEEECVKMMEEEHKTNFTASDEEKEKQEVMKKMEETKNEEGDLGYFTPVLTPELSPEHPPRFSITKAPALSEMELENKKSELSLDVNKTIDIEVGEETLKVPVEKDNDDKETSQIIEEMKEETQELNKQLPEEIKKNEPVICIGEEKLKEQQLFNDNGEKVLVNEKRIEPTENGICEEHKIVKTQNDENKKALIMKQEEKKEETKDGIQKKSESTKEVNISASKEGIVMMKQLSQTIEQLSTNKPMEEETKENDNKENKSEDELECINTKDFINKMDMNEINNQIELMDDQEGNTPFDLLNQTDSDDSFFDNDDEFFSDSLFGDDFFEDDDIFGALHSIWSSKKKKKEVPMIEEGFKHPKELQQKRSKKERRVITIITPINAKDIKKQNESKPKKGCENKKKIVKRTRRVTSVQELLD